MIVPTLQWKIHGENFMQNLRNSGIAIIIVRSTLTYIHFKFQTYIYILLQNHNSTLKLHILARTHKRLSSELRRKYPDILEFDKIQISSTFVNDISQDNKMGLTCSII